MGSVGASDATRSVPITIRASRRERDLIDRAARALGKSRADFVLETACREAQEVLLDRVVFGLDAEGFGRFNALLDSLPPPTDGLRRLLSSRAPWE